MKNIINVKCDDENFNIKIDGDNIDLLTAIAEILKKIESESNISAYTSLGILKKMVERDIG